MQTIECSLLSQRKTPIIYPPINELIDGRGPMDTFSTLNARAAYWSVEVVLLISFLPTPLLSFHSSFQRTMNIVLAPVLGRHTFAYLDDVISILPR